MSSSIQLAQQGFKQLAIFSNNERAQERAALHREKGNQAKVTPCENKKGEKSFCVWVKYQEV